MVLDNALHVTSFQAVSQLQQSQSNDVTGFVKMMTTSVGKELKCCGCVNHHPAGYEIRYIIHYTA